MKFFNNSFVTTLIHQQNEKCPFYDKILNQSINGITSNSDQNLHYTFFSLQSNSFCKLSFTMIYHFDLCAQRWRDAHLPCLTLVLCCTKLSQVLSEQIEIGGTHEQGK